MWPRWNRVQNTRGKSGLCLVDHVVCYTVRRDSSTIHAGRIYILFISSGVLLLLLLLLLLFFWGGVVFVCLFVLVLFVFYRLNPLPDEGGKESKDLEKLAADDLQEMPRTKPRKFAHRTRLSPALQQWWQALAEEVDVLSVHDV